MKTFKLLVIFLAITILAVSGDQRVADSLKLVLKGSVHSDSIACYLLGRIASNEKDPAEKKEYAVAQLFLANKIQDSYHRVMEKVLLQLIRKWKATASLD